MCKIHNKVGSLTAIKSHLRINDVNDFNSVNELITFQNNYSHFRDQVISEHSILVKHETDMLKDEILELEKSIEVNKCEAEKKIWLQLKQLQHQLNDMYSKQSTTIEKIIGYFRKHVLTKEIRSIEKNFDSKITYSIKQYTDELAKKNNRYKYIISDFSNAVEESGFLQLKELETKKRVIDEVNTLIYGAIGEQKVSKELEELSDNCILINDFACSFYPPIYNRKGNDYIKSIQIDHILISPGGVFLIETKNWSERSLNNLSLRSPVDQIKRTNFALFKILSEKVASTVLEKHHWGERKIPIRNIIVLLNQKPNEEFRYVKILTLKELCNYIEYFKPIFSVKETQLIANYLLKVNGRNN